jgi:hypothetical protein
VSLFKSSLVFDFWIFPLNHQLMIKTNSSGNTFHNQNNWNWRKQNKTLIGSIKKFADNFDAADQNWKNQSLSRMTKEWQESQVKNSAPTQPKPELLPPKLKKVQSQSLSSSGTAKHSRLCQRHGSRLTKRHFGRKFKVGNGKTSLNCRDKGKVVSALEINCRVYVQKVLKNKAKKSHWGFYGRLNRHNYLEFVSSVRGCWSLELSP